MVFTKLKEARKLLGLDQAEAASGSGLIQKDISLLENGKRAFIPTEYILFLYKQGIDINTLFDDQSEVKRRSQTELPTGITPTNGALEGLNHPKNSGQFVTKEEFSNLENLVKQVLKKLDK